MEKEFIPYEQALALKELGFDEPCFGYYDAYNGSSHLLLNDRYEPLLLIRTWQRLFSKKYQDTTFISQSYVEYINGVCLAPTFSQAFRWFREKYVLEHKILRDSYGCRYQITKVTSTSLEDIDCKGQYPNTSYEEAELECLKKLIEMVKGE